MISTSAKTGLVVTPVFVDGSRNREVERPAPEPNDSVLHLAQILSLTRRQVTIRGRAVAASPQRFVFTPQREGSACAVALVLLLPARARSIRPNTYVARTGRHARLHITITAPTCSPVCVGGAKHQSTSARSTPSPWLSAENPTTVTIPVQRAAQHNTCAIHHITSRQTSSTQRGSYIPLTAQTRPTEHAIPAPCKVVPPPQATVHNLFHRSPNLTPLSQYMPALGTSRYF